MMTLLKRNLNLSDESLLTRFVLYMTLILLFTCAYIWYPQQFLIFWLVYLGLLSVVPTYINAYLNRNKSYMTFRSLPTSDRKLLASFNLSIWLICGTQIISIAILWCIVPFSMVFEILVTLLSLTFLIATLCIKTFLDEAANKWMTYGMSYFLYLFFECFIIEPLSNGVDLYWFRVIPWILLIVSLFSFVMKTWVRYRRIAQNKIKL